MDPITIAMGLSQFVPQIARWITGSDKAEQVAQKAVDIAMSVTGAATGDGAAKALQADPALVLQYRKAVLEQEVAFQALAVQNAGEINATMRAEAASEHWPTYSWRPFIGFMFGAYIGSMWLLPLFGKTPTPISTDLTLAVGAILGVASWYRGKMQADPNIPTINRG
ncbi:MAG: 3TM-type holin [Gallionellaceae bacterium]|nr:3TM-type holin [Gallionellaceae bacterium]